ncbi:YggS family pyridoxal phosphate-dependent enzyme [soil metagenome]
MTSSSPSSLQASSLGSAIQADFETVRARIAAATAIAGRDPASVTLTAVSKTQPPDAIDAALSSGQRVFGENRVQEAIQRWSERAPTANGVELRLIGPLQTNKARDAVALFDVIETLDRERLIHAVADAAQTLGRSPRLLVQVNTGAEPQKAGVLPREVKALIASARQAGLTIDGLMAIPPVEEAAGLHFGLLAKLAARNGLEVLSMGMSADFEQAIRFGATHVRLGSALFGARPPMATPPNP